MASNCLLFLLLQAISAMFGKYVYVEERKIWKDAQDHCRKKYTDLAPISNEYDFNLLFEQTNADRKHDSIWIGLMRDPANTEQWLWSGEVTTFFWDAGQPNQGQNEDYGVMINYLWHDAPNMTLHFFCFNVHVVREEKTWPETMEYCREHHKDLASISSETELMLIQRELKEGVSTPHVWMGLCFLAGQWLWLDGNAAGYEAWGQGGKPECPAITLTCGALVFGGSVWEAHDCFDAQNKYVAWTVVCFFLTMYCRFILYALKLPCTFKMMHYRMWSCDTGQWLSRSGLIYKPFINQQNM
uniref:C-type lectin domain-containing protein n=1 Tax=Neogobius melanostomus TaxID=47308 RepID=A0A8C6UDG8_9GOBI